MSRRNVDPAGVIATLALAVATLSLWVGLGGTVPAARLLAAAALAVAGIAAAASARPAVPPEAPAVPWAFVAIPLALGALSLIPLPGPLLTFVSPLRAEVAGAGAFARDPYGARQALAIGLLAWGAGAVVAALPGWRHRDVERAAGAGVGLMAIVAATHAGAGLGSLFGMIRPQQANTTLFAPFVDSNHLAATILLLSPLATGSLERVDGRSRENGPWLLAAGGLAGLFAWADARAALVALGLAVAARAWAISRQRAQKTGVHQPFAAWWWMVPATAAVGVGVAALRDGGERLPIWTATARAALAHPLVGTGPGGYARAIPTFFDRPTLFHWTHAHSDPLEVVAEGGLLGVVAWLIAASAYARALRVHDPRVKRTLAGLGLLGLVSLIEFPLHLPLILALAATVAAWALRADGRPPAPRAVGIAGALAAVTSAGLMLSPNPEDAAAAAVIDAQVALRAGDRAPARAAAAALAKTWPDVPYWTHRATRLAVAAGDPVAAIEIASTSIRWAPFDERTWVDRAEAHCAAGDAEAGAADFARAVQLGGRHVALRDAYRCLPVGAWWSDALEGADPGHLEHLAAILLDEGDAAGALLAIDAAALADPGTFGASILEARAWERLDAPSQALAEAARVVAAHSSEPETMRLVAELRERLGDRPGSTEAWALAAADHRYIPAWVASVRRSQGPEAALAVASRERLLGRGSPELDALILDLERGK